jgi:hypothetical protein
MGGYFIRGIFSLFIIWRIVLSGKKVRWLDRANWFLLDHLSGCELNVVEIGYIFGYLLGFRDVDLGLANWFRVS